jgi:hypothetical protein
MVPSGLEEDCVWNPDRIIVLRRVAVDLAAREAADRRAAAEQHRREQQWRDEAREKSVVAAASRGRGQAVEPTTIDTQAGSPGRKGLASMALGKKSKRGASASSSGGGGQPHSGGSGAGKQSV